MEADSSKAVIRRLHVNDRAYLLPHTLSTLAYLGVFAAGLWTWQAGLWPVTVALWLLGGHLGHMKLIAVHESAHGTLSVSRFRNELQGIAVSTVILVPLSAYRYVHGQHHAYLATPRDLELWPFVNPGTPRWARILAATAELTIGFFYTPIIFLRGVLVGDNIPRQQLIRIALEYAATLIFWGTALAIVARNGWWTELVVAYLVPTIIAGNLQSLRKFTEHLGLLGSSILETTRTVVDPSLVGTALSESMLHIDYHGTHHRYAKLPYYNLPEATPIVYDGEQPELPLFPNYASAMLDMFRSLSNPRIGRQWIASKPAARPTQFERPLSRAA